MFDLVKGQQTAKLLASDGQEVDNFGESVAVFGDRAVIGARNDDDNGFDAGAAYVFDISTGQELFKLLASDGESDDEFGCFGAHYRDAAGGDDSDSDDGPAGLGAHYRSSMGDMAGGSESETETGEEGGVSRPHGEGE